MRNRNRHEYSNDAFMDEWSGAPEAGQDATHHEEEAPAFTLTRTVDKNPGMSRLVHLPDDGAYQVDTRTAAQPAPMTREQIDAMLAAKYAAKGTVLAVPQGHNEKELPAMVFDTRKGKVEVRADKQAKKEVKRRFITRKRVAAGLGVSAVMAGAWLGPREVVCNQSENFPALRQVMEWTGHVENDYRCEIPAPMFYMPDEGPMIIQGDN